MDTDFQQWDVISRDVDGRISTCLVTEVSTNAYTLYYVYRNWDKNIGQNFSILLKTTALKGSWRKVGYLKLNADFEIET